MKIREAEKSILRKNRKKWLGLLMAALVFSSSVPAGSVVYAEEPEEEKTAEAVSEEEEDKEEEKDTSEEEDKEEEKDASEEEDKEEEKGASEEEDKEEEKDTSEEKDASEAEETDFSEEDKDSEEAGDNATEEEGEKTENTGSEDPEEKEAVTGEKPAEDETENTAENGEATKENDEAAQPEGLEEGEEKSVSDPSAQELPEENAITIKETEPKQLAVEEVPEDEEEEAVYDGIVIDGKFEDWESVSKTDAGGSDEYQDFLEAVAVIQDGDYIYVYIRDSGIGAAAWSGPHGNGQFSLVTDLGYSVLFQLHSGNNGASVSISGVDGAECAYYTKGWGYSGEWEISIPVSELPNSRGSFAFGYYQAEPFIGEVADQRQKDDLTGNTGSENQGTQQEDDNIVFDGLYGDWSSYPHTLSQYATSGTWEKYVDGEGALYSDGGNLYGHVVTRMNAHLTEHGEEMQYGVVLRINQDNNLWFEFRLVDVDDDGRINWSVNVADQENGTHEYYIVDTRGWSNASTLDEITQGNNVYGRIRITKSDISDEAEWKLDLGLIAEHFGLEETDMQILEVKYERIGDKWLQTAGASTGPVAGILLSLTVAGSVMVLQRRKKGM